MDSRSEATTGQNLLEMIVAIAQNLGARFDVVVKVANSPAAATQKRNNASVDGAAVANAPATARTG
jgi:hypothetical protein